MYGVDFAPEYDLTSFTVPMALYYGLNDWLAVVEVSDRNLSTIRHATSVFKSVEWNDESNIGNSIHRKTFAKTTFSTHRFHSECYSECCLAEAEMLHFRLRPADPCNLIKSGAGNKIWSPLMWMSL